MTRGASRGRSARLWIAAGLFASVACSGIFPTPIRDILDHPEQYDGKRVTIEGEVDASANLVLVRYYRLRDQTGSLAVVTPKAVPRKGAHVKVSGIVHQAFVLGDQNLTVLNEGE
jgi:hypothetical protein